MELFLLSSLFVASPVVQSKSVSQFSALIKLWKMLQLHVNLESTMKIYHNFTKSLAGPSRRKHRINAISFPASLTLFSSLFMRRFTYIRAKLYHFSPEMLSFTWWAGYVRECRQSAWTYWNKRKSDQLNIWKLNLNSSDVPTALNELNFSIDKLAPTE